MAEQFDFSRFGSTAGEPHVYVVESEIGFPNGFNTVGARVVGVSYKGGGWGSLFRMVADAMPDEGISTHHIQAFYEDLELIAKRQPLVLHIRGADLLSDDVGISLLGAAAHWEAFVRHGNGLTPMYLVLEASSEALNRAWKPKPRVPSPPSADHESARHCVSFPQLRCSYQSKVRQQPRSPRFASSPPRERASPAGWNAALGSQRPIRVAAPSATADRGP